MLFQKTFDQLLEEQKDLRNSRDDRREMTKQFKQRTEKLTLDSKKDELSYRDQLAQEKVPSKAAWKPCQEELLLILCLCLCRKRWTR